jgi:hypothetical protein
MRYQQHLVIAQLVERWTVEGLDSSVQISIGHWFDSGSRDITFVHFLNPRTLLFSLFLKQCSATLPTLYEALS